MRRFNGIPKNQFPLFLRECEWRFNYRPTQNLFKVLLAWAKLDLLQPYLGQPRKKIYI